MTLFFPFDPLFPSRQTADSPPAPLPLRPNRAILVNAYVFADSARATWTYDDAYQLLSENQGPLGYIGTYTYDPVGNRATLDDGIVTTYTYDSTDQLVKLVNWETSTLIYDQNGNMSVAVGETGPVFTLTLDYEDRMTGAVANDLELPYTATFDPDHKRVWGSETIGAETATTNFLWDEQNVALKTDPGGAPLSKYTNEPQRYGNLVSQRQGSTSGFFHFDGLGSTAEISDSSQAVANKCLYTAFGLPVACS